MAEETIYGSEVPAGSFEEGSALSLGTKFTVSANGTCKRGRFYCPPAGAGGAVILRLWRVDNNNQMANVTISSPVFDSWNEAAWTQGDQALVPGVEYEVSYATPNRYGATTGYTWPKSSAGGHITSSTPGGYFGSGSTSRPNGTVGNNNYFADAVIDFAASGTTTVSGTLDLRWQVIARVSGSLDLRWAVSAPVSGSLDLRWQVLSRVSSTLDLRWATLSTVSGALDVRWQVLTAVSGSLDLRWAQFALVAGTLDLRWATAGKVSGSIDLQWAVLNAVAGTLDLRWAVRSQISGSLDLRWIVLGRVAGSLALLWVTDGINIRLVAMATAQLTERFAVTPVLETITADLVER